MTEDRFGPVINRVIFLVKENKMEIITSRDYSELDCYIIRILKNGKEIKEAKEKIIGVEKTNKKIFSLRKYYRRLYE